MSVKAGSHAQRKHKHNIKYGRVNRDDASTSVLVSAPSLILASPRFTRTFFLMPAVMLASTCEPVFNSTRHSILFVVVVVVVVVVVNRCRSLVL